MLRSFGVQSTIFFVKKNQYFLLVFREHYKQVLDDKFKKVRHYNKHTILTVLITCK